MCALQTMMNSGERTCEQLRQVGIETPEELRRIGSRDAWLRIQAIDASACIHRLYGLEGAIRGVKKTVLPAKVKEELKMFYRAHRLVGAM